MNSSLNIILIHSYQFIYFIKEVDNLEEVVLIYLFASNLYP